MRVNRWGVGLLVAVALAAGGLLLATRHPAKAVAVHHGPKISLGIGSVPATTTIPPLTPADNTAVACEVPWGTGPKISLPTAVLRNLYTEWDAGGYGTSAGNAAVRKAAVKVTNDEVGSAAQARDLKAFIAVCMRIRRADPRFGARDGGGTL